MRAAAAAAASAALLIFHLLLPAPAALSGGGPLNDDVLGLIVFKSGLDDPTSALSSWTENDDTPCSWAHVQCDPSTSRVIRLLLSSLSLSSPRLPRGLDRLSSLQSISLSGNTISGDLPRSLSLLSSLSLLDLSSNSLSGRIPSDLPSLLRSLDLSSNSLSGPLPPISCSSLRFLDLSGNLLEGPLPPAISSCSFLLHLNLSSNSLSGDIAPLLPLSRLRVLDLSHNSFTGAVPESLAFLHNLRILHLNANRFSGAVPVGFSAHLTRLDLSHNSFHGPIPASIQLSLASLSFISFSQNQLSGDIPHWIGNNTTALQHLDLSQNQLTGNIPGALSALTGLRYLSLSDNMLTGEIPASLSQCGTLDELHVNRNQLNGAIPEAIFELGLAAIDLSSNSLSGGMPAGSSKLAETLTSLDLSDNRLTGVIPPELALYFKLQYLNLSWNHLHTRIPPEIGYFRNLTVLDLRNASLYGEIPPDLCDCGSLAVLQLDENLLSGEIPEEIGNCSSLYLLSLSFNGLVGRIPTAMSELKRLKILKLEMNALSGEIPQQLGGLDSLLAVNISHNRLVGRLPIGGVFPSLDQSALQGNLGLCTPLVAEPCKMNVPKPLVLDPNAYGRGMGSNNVSGSLVTTPRSRHMRFLSVSAVVAMSAALVIILGVVVVSLLNFSARRRVWVVEKNPVPDSSIKSSPRPMSPAAAAAGKMVLFGPEGTEDFVGSGAESLLSRAVEIGKGAFGTVYRASIGEGRDIAIKRLITSNIVEQQDIFDGELRALGMAKHPNLMPLKGYFWTPELQVLISDYAPHGSLHDRLAAAAVAPLTWAERYKIVLGTARGLAYLHHSIRPPIIHYSMKPSNVLLDERCNPMVSDFGLSRLLPKLDEHVISSRFQAGTMGYVAPELACRSLRINEKCDVYGFGVVVLEVVTGRRAVEYGDDDVVVLMDQVRGMMEQGRGGECVDQGMGEFPEEEVLPVLKLGMVCTSQIPSSRPSMAEVVQILELIKSPVVDNRIGGYNY